jgi:hypothetical protein
VSPALAYVKPHGVDSPSFLDTFHVLLVTHLLYWYMVVNFGDYNALGRVVWYVVN